MEKRYIYDSTMLGYLEQNIGSIDDRIDNEACNKLRISSYEAKYFQL